MSATYPAAPWRLSGRALAILRLVPIERIAPQVPKPLSIIPIAPGRTLSIFYVAQYGESSTLQYHECIVAPALVRKGARVGAWISNIYVDNELSMEAGRDIWGLPKQLAKFDWRWEERGRVAMIHDEATFELVGSQVPTRWPMPVVAGAFGSLGSELKWFAVRGGARVAKSEGKLWTRSGVLTTCDFDWSGSIYSLKMRTKIGAPTHLR
jgi:hypothetical protein